MAFNLKAKIDEAKEAFKAAQEDGTIDAVKAAAKESATNATATAKAALKNLKK